MNIIQTILLLFLSIFNWGGIYVADFDYMVYATPRLCIHEQGHQRDYYLGYPSQTKEFKNIIDNGEESILLAETTCIVETEFCLYKEVYAQLWTLAEGDINKIPKELREFYQE